VDGTRTAAYFLAVNRNKRSIRIDLHRPAGADLLRRLLGDADVVVENFRAGGFERLGFDDEALNAINSRLVHLSITGYGPAAPDPSRPGYDFVIQAESGLMSITGGLDEDGGGPTKVGVAITDVATGLQGAVAILAALIGRSGGSPTDAPGGQRIDVSLLGSTLALLVNQAQNAFVDGVPPGRLGNAHPNIVPYETFETADGAIAVAVGSERQWPRFCRALGLPALADEPRFASNGERVTNRQELVATLSARLAERGSDEWLTALDAADIPAGPINDIAAAFHSPWAAGRTIELEHPRLGRTRQVRPAFDLLATPATVRTPPPLLGEHTDEILAEIGVDAAGTQRLRREGVV
jgi:crotonobetainyl-CoA:carnitine CoA-transferase CaiB-like acyl-CoA transferase